MKKSLSDQLERFLGKNNSKSHYLNEKGEFSETFLFHDWFCKIDELESRAENLMNKVITFVARFNVDTDNVYVNFKNCLPGEGEMYDYFTISELKTGKHLYYVTPCLGYKSTKKDEKAEVNILDLNEVIVKTLSGPNLEFIYKNLLHERI
jgi:hypothetical protein